jgi:hypothetical protein
MRFGATKNIREETFAPQIFSGRVCQLVESSFAPFPGALLGRDGGTPQLPLLRKPGPRLLDVGHRL